MSSRPHRLDRREAHMTIRHAPLFASVAILSACATGSSLRSIPARAQIVQGSSSGFVPVAMHADENRLVGVARDGLAFVAVAERDGCVTMRMRLASRRYCPVSDGLFHAIGDASQFGVALNQSSL